MALENVETKLTTDYESLRRREYELITNLLEVLPKIDNLDQERVAQVRDALFHADHPYLMVFVGPFSSGKSSIINALLGKPDLLPVGPIPTTDRINILRWGEEPRTMRSGDVDTVFFPSPLLQKVSFVDTPGLESVFQKHEETTRRFLHRSDVVLLVMLATQAMTARNVEYLRMLREYGKTVIVIINQADLLSDEEEAAVHEYVLEQSQTQLGFKPEVWMVSARDGLAARSDGTLDPERWQASGLGKIESYVNQQLSDVARLRQKLQTPMQIIQNVNRTALEAVRSNQSTLDQYRSIGDNLNQQLLAQRREQDRLVRETTDELSDKFGQAAMRGSEAIRDVFRLSRGLVSALRGTFELFGLSGLLRRGVGGSYIGSVFQSHRAFEPIDELPVIADRLAPRLEGKDVQDIDDLVKYGRREIEALPAPIRTKVIGNVQAPIQYDRSALQAVRDDLAAIADEARVVETEKLERTLRNTMLYLAAYIILVVVLGLLFFNLIEFPAEQPLAPAIAFVIFLALVLFGFLLMPLRGRIVENDYTRRMLVLQRNYIETLTKAAEKQVTYGMNLRRDAVLPLTRLVEAQTQIQTEQLGKLQAAQEEIVRIEADLTTLGRKSLLGLRG